MKVKKLTALFLASALGVSALAGCSGGNTASDKDEQGRTVISVGNWPTKEGDDMTKMEKYKSEFETENPTMAITGDNWKYDKNSFYSKASAGQLPTLYYSWPTETASIVSGGYYTDLTDGLKRSGYYDKFNPVLMKTVSKNGEIVAFPTMSYSLALIYNVDLFEQAGLMNEDGTPMQPETWEEVAEFGVKIKEATGKDGFIIPTMNNCGGWIFTPIAWSYGVEFMTEKDGNYTATFDNDKMVNALQYISDLKWKYDIFSDNSLIDLDEYYKQFAIGNVGMILAAASVTDELYKYEMPIENIGVMPVPSGPERRVTLMGGSQAVVKNGATEDQVDVAIKWLEKVGNGINKVDELARENMEADYQKLSKDGKLIGIQPISVFSEKNEYEDLRLEMIDKYKNIDINHVKLYNDSLTDTSIELQAEEPKCAQELYAKLDGVIQEILTNKNADIKALISQASKEFQRDYLD